MPDAAQSLLSRSGSFTATTPWEHFVEGSDIATTTATYLHWTAASGLDYGKQFLYLAVLPVPAVIWPTKYKYFGTGAAEKYIASGAAAGFFTILYTSFGVPGVVFGTALLGRCCKQIYRRYRNNLDDVFGQISVALLWAYSFHLYGRHSITLAIGGLVFVFGPVWAVKRLVLRRQRRLTSLYHAPLLNIREHVYNS